ncbi:MAG: diaminopimelate decarboxylase [Synergistaceae bacterium]|jgi:diaminopimelate decarboxylase|nr:diaminopimelate decarboxylase [Synergistaceae bacterium]
MGHLVWGGANCVELARTYGTPLYVVDEGIVRARCAEVRTDFLERWPGSAACYASKAFLTTCMAWIINQEGLGLDVVSGGELYTALRAGFSPSRIELHGNAKSEEELRLAFASGVGHIIADGIMELQLLDGLAEEIHRAPEVSERPRVLLRVAPGVEPHTHTYLVTGQVGSKFGLPLETDSDEDGLLSEAVRFAMASRTFDLTGFHFHIGSQIFENATYIEAVKRIVACMGRMREKFGFETRELNFGGGFGVPAAPDEPHLPLRHFTDAMMETLKAECAARKLPCPSVTIEPGRWIISDAGITLYSVETIKRLKDVTYVGVDGGMADNPRPSLYGAQYVCKLANKIGLPPEEKVVVAGRCCETGDILVESAELPRVERGDVLAVFSTGAYNFSMASGYNRLLRPAVVLVRDGMSDLIVARQTWEDLLAGDCIPQRLLY